MKRLDLPISVASAIKAAAKAHQTRFSYIISACVLLALAANAENPETGKAAVSPFAPVDGRRWFLDQERAAKYRGGAYYGGSVLSVSNEIARVSAAQ